MSDDLFTAAMRRCEQTGSREQGMFDDEHGRTYWSMSRDPSGTVQVGFAGNLLPDAVVAESPAPLTEETLAEIEARANAATPGPWIAETDPMRMVGVRPVYESHVPGCTMTPEELAADVSNAEFVAHAREDVPALVAEVRRLAEKLERIRLVVGVMRTPPLTTGNMASELARLRREVGFEDGT